MWTENSYDQENAKLETTTQATNESINGFYPLLSFLCNSELIEEEKVLTPTSKRKKPKKKKKSFFLFAVIKHLKLFMDIIVINRRKFMFKGNPFDAIFLLVWYLTIAKIL